MQNLEISLLYPDMDALTKGVDGVDRACIPTEVLDELQFTTIMDLKSGRLCDFFLLAQLLLLHYLRFFL